MTGCSARSRNILAPRPASVARRKHEQASLSINASDLPLCAEPQRAAASRPRPIPRMLNRHDMARSGGRPSSCCGLEDIDTDPLPDQTSRPPSLEDLAWLGIPNGRKPGAPAIGPSRRLPARRWDRLIASPDLVYPSFLTRGAHEGEGGGGGFGRRGKRMAARSGRRTPLSARRDATAATRNQ